MDAPNGKTVARSASLLSKKACARGNVVEAV